jgi:hypothetical protein
VGQPFEVLEEMSRNFYACKQEKIKTLERQKLNYLFHLQMCCPACSVAFGIQLLEQFLGRCTAVFR